MKRPLLIALAAALLTLVIYMVLPFLQHKPDRHGAHATRLQAYANEFLSGEDLEALGQPTPDRPDLAAFQEFLQTMDPALGRVPLERRMPAVRKAREMANLKGLQQVISGWDEKPANMGGRTRAILFDPADSTHRKVWAAGVTGGLWYTNDIGNPDSLWHPVNNFWDNLSVGCLAADPNNDQVLYAGTGEAATAVVIYRESSGRGNGILRSVDGGQTWNLIPSTAGFAYVTDIKVRNENGTSVIYAGVVSGKYKGVDHLSSPSDGLYRSSDNGQNWTQVLPDIPGTTTPYAPSDIELSADGRIFVGTGPNTNLQGGAVILHSDTGTQGTWTAYTQYNTLIQASTSYPLPGRVMLAAAPSNSNVIYAIIANGWNNGFNYYQGGYIIRTTNKGASWSQRNMPPDYDGRNWANLAWHAFTIGVDPNNMNTLWVGGLDLHRSTNGGSSWTRFTDWALMYYGGGDDYVHADQHAIIYRPGSSAEILFGTDGGVFRTTNATAATPVFTERSHGFNTLQFYTAAIHPVAGSQRVMGGLQDNGTLVYDGSPLSIFSMITGGDGAYCFVDEDEPGIFLTCSQYSNFYVFEDSNFMDYISASTGVFINPSAYDYKDNLLFMNRGTFFGNNLNSLERAEGIPYNVSHYDIPVLAGASSYFSNVTYSRHSAVGSPVLFLGTAAGEVYRVTNAQSLIPQVTEITGSQFPAAAVSCIEVGHSNDSLLVTFSNYGVASVWQTTDGGLSWENKEGNLPDMPIRWALYHPDNGLQALVATEAGVWSTSNLNQPNPWWVPVNSGMANVRVDMLRIRYSDNTVLAATHGRGLFTTTYLVDPSAGGSQPRLSSVRVYPNPSDGIFRIDGMDGTARLQLYDLEGRLVLDARGADRIDLRGQSAGTYLLRMSTSSEEVSRKLVLQ